MKNNSYIKITKKYFLSGYIIPIQISLVIMQFIKLIFPLYTKYIIDYLLVKQYTDFNYYIIAIFVVLMFLYAILNYFSNKSFFKYVNKRTTKMKMDYISQILSDNAEFYSTKSFADITYRLTNDLSNVTNSWTTIFGALPAQLLSIIPIFYLIKESSILKFITIISILLNSLILVIHLFRIEHLTKQAREASQNYNHQLIDKLSRHDEIRSLGIQSKVSKKIYDSIINLNEKNLSYFQRIKKFEIFIFALNTSWSIIMLFIGASLINKNVITLGSLISFITLSNMIFQPINVLITTLKNLKDIKNSAERIDNYFPNVKGKLNTNKLVNNITTISCENLSVLDIDGKDLLVNLNININAPGIYTIKGANGIGKSTFAKCLIKECQRYTGKIEINKINIKDLKYEDLKNHIIYINSTNTIFDETMKWNICFDEENIINHQYDWLLPLSLRNKLPYGFETILNDDLLKFSNGEKQIIYLIRAIYLNPDVLIIDEPETAIDETIVLKIKKLLLQMGENKIIILISHNKDFLSLSKEENTYNFDLNKKV